MGISEKEYLSLYKMTNEEIDKNFNFLGEGISRKVYRLDDSHVLKVAKDKEGIYQNKVENYVYTNTSTYYNKYLCPIICFKPNLLIMKKAMPLSESNDSKFINVFKFHSNPNFYKDLNYLADKFYLFYEDLISTSSWGIVDDEYKLIDYGCTSMLGDIYYDLKFLFS